MKLLSMKNLHAGQDIEVNGGRKREAMARKWAKSHRRRIRTRQGQSIRGLMRGKRRGWRILFPLYCHN
jgi:hypothetical protein